MTNNEKIQKAEQLIAEANVLLNEVNTEGNSDEDIIAKYKNDYNKGRKYYLNNLSDIDFINKGDSFKEIKRFSQSPYQYYLTKELAKQAKELKDFNDKLLAFKYCYDMDYKPDWNEEPPTTKYYVYCNVCSGKYETDGLFTVREPLVYFSTKEIAQKCADWLNSLSE